MVGVLVGGLLVSAALLLNLRATRAVLRDELSSPAQRRAQVAFVWILPFLGALLAIYLKRRDRGTAIGGYPEEADADDDIDGDMFAAPSDQGFEQGLDGGDSGGGDGGGGD